MGPTLLLRVPAPVTDELVRGLCVRLQEQLGTHPVGVVVCSVDRGAGDLVTVDALARLALVARRAGVAFRLDDPGVALSSLLALVGLAGALAGPDEA